MPAAAHFLLPPAASLSVAAAVPHVLDQDFAAAGVESPKQAELARRVGAGRAVDACLDEADGKALVERADWLARAGDATRRGSRP